MKHHETSWNGKQDGDVCPLQQVIQTPWESRLISESTICQATQEMGKPKFWDIPVFPCISLVFHNIKAS